MKNEFFIEKARNIHGDKYDYSKVEYINSQTKVCIVCPKHGEFWQKPSEHLRGSGCPKCVGRNKTNEDVIEQFIKVHGDKYDYSKVEYVNNNTKICIICPEHGEFWQTPHSHLIGRGCSKCYKKDKVCSIIEFLEKAKEVHGDKYDYSKVEYINSRTKVCIVCPEHGEFWQTPSAHLNNRKCPRCARPSYNTKSFIEKAKEVYGDKYDYSKVEYINNRTKVCIICPEHGEFWQTPNVHLQGSACPLCYNKSENKLFFDLVNIFGIDAVVRQKTFKWLKNAKTGYHQYLDFYITTFNIAIELQGDQHFIQHRYWDKNEESFLKRAFMDINKKKMCDENGVKIYYFAFNKKWDTFLNEKVYHDVSEINF